MSKKRGTDPDSADYATFAVFNSASRHADCFLATFVQVRKIRLVVNDLQIRCSNID